MNNDKLREIGKELAVTRKDIKTIQKEKAREKYLYPIMGILLNIGAIIKGFILARERVTIEKASNSSLTYPVMTTAGYALCYGVPLVSFVSALAGINIMKTRNFPSREMNIIITALAGAFAIIAFIISYEVFRPVDYSGGILYGVYSREENGGNVK